MAESVPLFKKLSSKILQIFVSKTVTVANSLLFAMHLVHFTCFKTYHFSASIYIQQLSTVKVKSSSSTVIYSNYHLNHQFQLFLFQTLRKHRVSLLLAQKVEYFLQKSNQKEFPIFLLFPNIQVLKMSVCQAHICTA